jgi:hypothetical protein
MAEARQDGFQVLLERETGMVGTQGDAHFEHCSSASGDPAAFAAGPQVG